MKKAIIIGLAVFIITTAAALSASWFIQANHVKKSIEKSIAEFDPALGSISVEAITVTGFPKAMDVTLVKPKATLYTQKVMPSLYKYISAGMGSSAGVLAPPTFPNSTLDMALDGNITLSVNTLSSRFSYRSSGNFTHNVTDGATTLYTQMSQKGDIACDLGFEGDIMSIFSQSWDMTALFNKDGTNTPFRTFECAFPASTAINATSGETLFSQEASQLRVGLMPTQNRNHFTLYLHMPRSEIFAAGDAFFTQMMPLTLPEEYRFPMQSMSAYGKMVMLIDAEAESSADKEKVQTEPFSINIKNYRFENAFNTNGGHFILHSTPKNGDQHITLDMSIATDFSIHQKEYAQQMLEQMLTELDQLPVDPSVPSPVNLLKGHPREKLLDVGMAALPNVSEMGTFNTIIKADFNGNPEKRTVRFALPELQLTSREFGILGNGSGEMQAGQMLPAINANLNCRGCIAMIDTLEGYLWRVEENLATVEPSLRGQIALQPDMVMMIKNVLAGVGRPSQADAANLEFAITGDTANLQINGKSIMDIMALASQPAP